MKTKKAKLTITFDVELDNTDVDPAALAAMLEYVMQHQNEACRKYFPAEMVDDGLRRMLLAAVREVIGDRMRDKYKHETVHTNFGDGIEGETARWYIETDKLMASIDTRVFGVSSTAACFVTKF